MSSTFFRFIIPTDDQDSDLTRVWQGLFQYARNDLRRLNAMITAMCNEGIMEKTMVYQPARRQGMSTNVQCLRLLPQKEHEGDPTTNQGESSLSPGLARRRIDMPLSNRTRARSGARR
jgi:hypothetical protein